MAGGRRIDDHKAWMGSAPKGQVFHDQAKTKTYSSASSDGELNDYWDTTEKIEQAQNMGARDSGAQAMRPGYRY